MIFIISWFQGWLCGCSSGFTVVCLGVLLRHADCADKVLMMVGFIGAVGDGCTLPLRYDVVAELMNNIGGSSALNDPDYFIQKITPENYERLLNEYFEKEINKSPDEIYYELVGGYKKGSVHGHMSTCILNRPFGVILQMIPRVEMLATPLSHYSYYVLVGFENL